MHPVGDDNEYSTSANSGPIPFMNTTTRSGRKIKPTSKLMETLSREGIIQHLRVRLLMGAMKQILKYIMMLSTKTITSYKKR